MERISPRTQWQAFLAGLDTGLDALSIRAEAPAGTALPPVIEDPSRQVAAREEILIGIGRWATRDARGDFVTAKHAGICLQDKGAPSPSGRRYASLSEFVATVGDEMWTDWAAKAAPARAPGEVLERFTLVVEDASPDSCFGLICFLARLAGVPAADIPADWLDYVRRWEAGDVRTTGEAFASWGALHTALAHSYIGSNGRSAGGNDPALHASRNEAFGRAWLACLRFDVAVLRAGALPHDVAGVRPSHEHLLARAFLNYEYQQYLQGLLHATCVQLLLPMAGEGRRYKLIDAYFEDEQIPLGAKKVFLRNDREHTWLRDGFALMGLHKPGEKGSGNDMTLSVDPASGVHLEELWRELERLEDERWGAARPADNPRLGIKGYPEGRREDGRNAPNQPWYDDRGHYTLIAAPKRLTDGELGSRLSWREVRDAAWRLYNPLRFLQVQAPDRRVCSIEALSGSLRTPPGKRLIIAEWLKAVPEQQSLLLSPTAKRCFAACAARREGKVGPLALDELPDEASFDFLTLPGGLAVVHRDGVFLLDDWRNEALNISDLEGEFAKVSERLETIEDVRERFERLVGEIEDLVAGKGRPKRTDFDLLSELSVLKVRIQRRIADTAPHSSDPAALTFREVLERRWGVASKLEDFHEAVAQMETTLRDYSELRTNRIINWLTIYGFPAVLFASFFQFVTTGFPAELRVGEQVWHFTWGGVNWFGLALYGMLALSATMLLRLLMRRRQDRQ